MGEVAKIGTKIGSTWTIECYDKDGNLKWKEVTHNLTTNVGRQYVLDTAFSGATADSAWFVGLIDGSGVSPTLAVTDTMETHAGWSEYTTYSEGARQAFTENGVPSTADPSVWTNSSDKAVFSINNDGVVEGAFLNGDATKSGTPGILYGENTFTERTVANGDTVNVQVDVELYNS